MKRKAIVAAALAAAMTATLITGCGKSKEAAFPDPEKTITLIERAAARIPRPVSWWRP